MIDDDISEQIKEEVAAIEEERVLFGFLKQIQAEQWMRRHHGARNRGGPHLSDAEWERIWNEELQDEFVDLYSSSSSDLSTDVDFKDTDVDPQELPDTDEVREHISEFEQSNYFREAFGDVPSDEWSIKLVPIESLVAFQARVATHAYQDVPTSGGSWRDVLKYCLPCEVSNYVMSRAQSRGSQGGDVQFVSRSPNVNVIGPFVEEIRTKPEGNIEVTFQVRTRPNFVQVAHFGDRYFLKNGYHRSFQLMRQGEEFVPAILREVDEFADTGANGSFFSRDRLMGDRPPLVSDFDSDIAVEFDCKATNTVVRIEGDKFQAER